jgi:hypothetical protein
VASIHLLVVFFDLRIPDSLDFEYSKGLSKLVKGRVNRFQDCIGGEERYYVRTKLGVPSVYTKENISETELTLKDGMWVSFRSPSCEPS